jgi:hypothetical protein
MNRRTFFKGFATILTFSTIKPYFGKQREIIRNDELIIPTGKSLFSDDKVQFFVSVDGGKTYEPLGEISTDDKINFMPGLDQLITEKHSGTWYDLSDAAKRVNFDFDLSIQAEVYNVPI